MIFITLFQTYVFFKIYKRSIKEQTIHKWLWTQVDAYGLLAEADSKIPE